MNNTIKSALTVGLATAALALAAFPAHAEVHSKSKDLVVLEPRDLPELAQAGGNSLFLHSDNSGNTYLYVEQQQGTRITVFDVTDPSHIKMTASAPLPAEGAFDFIRPLGDYAELIYFRDGQKTGVFDLRRAKKPELHTVSAVTGLSAAENLGPNDLLASSESYKYVPAVGRDYQVIDISAANPSLLTTVKEVKHRVTNGDTGTTFLLGSDGLTVVRQISVETEYKIHQMQMRGN